MDLAEARGAAQAKLDAFSTADNPLQLVGDDAVADVGWGWVFAYSTRRWFETRDDADAPPPGIGPIVVVKDSGETFTLGSTPSFDMQLAEYADRHDLPAPTPLGW
jgi:Immunity protein 35